MSTVPRHHVAALVPGGVLDLDDRITLVVELLALGDENPEVDPEALGEVLLRAARALWADGMFIGLEA